MNLQQIKQAVDNGQIVYYQNALYTVVKDEKKSNQYLIKCSSNGHCIGLTWADEVTLNGKEDDFYTF